ncbi:MAG TPA: HAD family hydrolase [Rheinheimera sp.]|nr:HAD family hydrolase [Rheinheimera sp.]
MQDVKLVVFDWDGTVMDSVAKIVRSLQIAAIENGRSEPSWDEAKQVIGLSLDPAMAMLFPDADANERQLLGDGYKKAYSEIDTTPTPLYPHAQHVFASLRHRGYQLGVATGKARRGLDRMWRETGTGEFFTTSRCSDEAQSKPHPDMLMQILQEQQLAPHEVVMIGDSRFDMQMAHAAKVHRIGITHGVHGAADFAPFQPHAVVDDLLALLELLPERSV